MPEEIRSKVCTRCKQEKPVESFPKKGSDRLCSLCDVCENDRTRNEKKRRGFALKGPAAPETATLPQILRVIRAATYPQSRHPSSHERW